MARLLLIVWLAECVLQAQGIASRNISPPERSPNFSNKPFNARFTDIAAQAGLTNPIIYGGETETTYLLETSSGGIALLDYDNDGWLDIFVMGGTQFTDPPPANATNRLYRNKRDGTFEDVTRAAGLERSGWASGVTAADYDSDGRTDLFVTYYGNNALYHNNGDGTFTDVAEQAGLIEKPARPYPRWHSGATFIDYDLDGKLDLFIANYVDYDIRRIPKPGENAFCEWKGIAVACGPRGLPAGRQWLYHNEGNGKFRDVSDASGIAKAKGSFCFTALAADFDGDGWTDIYVACDSTPSFLFHNNHNGSFAEQGMERGLALSDDGREQAGMGIGVGDFDLDGRFDLLKTHFADDIPGLYQQFERGNFRDVSTMAGLGSETRLIGWGAGIYDFDNDGLPDLFMVAGGVYPETAQMLPAYPYEARRLLFRNLGNGKFEDMRGHAGPAIDETHSSRGCAFGDLDNDGDIDVVIWNRNEPPSLLRNDGPREGKGANHWLGLKLVGVKSNRDAVGALIELQYGARKQEQAVVNQSSFLSSNDPRLHFGLGDAQSATAIVTWPGGRKERFAALSANRYIELKEGSGTAATTAPPSRKTTKVRK